MADQMQTIKTHQLPLTENWRLVSDQVMGGRSSGTLILDQVHNEPLCLHLRGNVSTANNGGFIQMAYELNKSEQAVAANAGGIRLWVKGNGDSYNLHLRTLNLWLPWQSYRASFNAQKEWHEVDINFNQFKAYKTSKALDLNKIRRIAVVAIGREFEADVCIAGIGFYD